MWSVESTLEKDSINLSHDIICAYMSWSGLGQQYKSAN